MKSRMRKTLALLLVLLHDLKQGTQVFPAHPVQLFFCKERIHHTASLS